MQKAKLESSPQGIDSDEESDFEESEQISPEDITVAVFCALAHEAVAVRYILDQEFECRYVSLGPRKYIYSFGRIGSHNIVISRPHQMGTVQAAQCAATVSQQFPNLRFALMIGIGAGIPNLPQRDIRLGDIAVSIPKDNHPGVLQYDFGKYEVDGEFFVKGILDKPPPLLVSADGSLEEDEMMGRSKLKRILRDISKQPGYARPTAEDVLFDAQFHHICKGGDCSSCDASAEKKVITRHQRDIKPGQPVVHRGLILSGGGVIKNPEDRDRFRRGYKDAICFEMEAAGIMDQIPCMVVRGICDYADTHKQDGWHRYAAAVAAAYGKTILLKVYTQEMSETPAMRDIMEKVERHIDIMSSDIHELKLHANDAKEDKLRAEISEWLSAMDHWTRHHDIYNLHQEGTGTWLLRSLQFETWLRGDSETLFCPGIPGSGKTIMSSIVIEHLLTVFPCHEFSDHRIAIAFLYCDYKRREQLRSLQLLSSLLDQLLKQLPSIPTLVRSLHDRNAKLGRKPSLENIQEALGSILTSFGRVYIVIDALDECENETLIQMVNHLRILQSSADIRLMVTSRQITRVAQHFMNGITLPIEAQNDDIEKYIDGNMKRLRKFVWEASLVKEVKNGIIDAARGMFLLARLHLVSLADQVNPKKVRRTLEHLPRGEAELQDAYGSVWQRIQEQPHELCQLAERVLSWIVHSERLFSPKELQYALAVEPEELELDDQNLCTIELLESVCLGLVTIDHKSNTIRLIHFTTQQYFDTAPERWHSKAQMDIARTCIAYMSFNTFQSGFCSTDEDLEERLQQNPFYDYAARNWGHHARELGMAAKEWIIQFFLHEDKLNASSQAMMVARRQSYIAKYSQQVPRRITGLHLAACFGLDQFGLLTSSGQCLDARDGHNRTPISYAAEYGHEAMTRLLLDKGAEPDTKDKFSQTPLWYAIKNRHDAIVKLLVENQANPNSADNFGQTPLSYVAENNLVALFKVIVECRPGPGLKDKDGRTPLSYAAENGQKAIAELLLSDKDSRDRSGLTPLFYATKKRHESIVKLLVENAADPNVRDQSGRTPLSYAAERGLLTIANTLIGNKANPDLSDSFGQTPLSYASENGQEAIVKLLLNSKANADLRDVCGRTPLSHAAEKGALSVVRLLVQHNVDLELQDVLGRTPLSYAAIMGHEATLQQLVESKAKLDQKEKSGYTPLLEAIKKNHGAIIKILIDSGADLDLEDDSSQRALSYAVREANETLIRLLIERGASIDFDLDSNQTPLSWAAANGNKAVVELLIDKGADHMRKDKSNHTALSRATLNGHGDIVTILLDKSVHIDPKGEYIQTPMLLAIDNGSEHIIRLFLKRIGAEPGNGYSGALLLRASEARHRAIVDLLLQEGADPETISQHGQKLLLLATERGHETSVRLLLGENIDVDWKENYTWTLLLSAAEHGHRTIIRLFLNRLNPEPDYYRMLLLWASKTGHEVIFNFLMKEIADSEVKDEYGQSPVLLTAGENYNTFLGPILDSNTGLKPKRKLHLTPLLWAVGIGSKVMVDKLLENGADLESTASLCHTPLSYAAAKGDEDIVRLLIDKGAKLESGKCSALISAAKYGHEAIVRLLIGRGANLEATYLYHTPLSYAAAKGDEDIVRLLVDKGAKLQSGKFSALISAAKYGHEAIVRLLVDRGADLESTASLCHTALSYAAAKGDEDIVRLLIDKGAKLESGQFLPLMSAVESGHEAIVRLLVDRGANLEATYRYHTPLSYASLHGHQGIVDFLLSKGAKRDL